MTDLRKAAEMALEALDGIHVGNMTPMAEENWNKATEALRQALAQDKQEPVAYLDAVDNKTVYVAPNRKSWLDPHEDKEWMQFHYDHCHDTPLYTAPISKPWVSLTSEELASIVVKHTGYPTRQLAAIEAKLKEKNNG